MGVSRRSGFRAVKLPTLLPPGKNVLRLALTLAISPASMGIPWLGFEHVSEAVAAYRKSVTEADLARSIARELIAYRALVRYYVATGKEEDAKAAISAEAGLKDAIDASMRGTTNPARLEQITKLARIPRLHKDLRRDPEDQGRERLSRQERVDPQRNVAGIQARRPRQHRGRSRFAGGGLPGQVD